ncbi:HIPL1 protein-like [Macadamia integrifolia]|uniref:HIPL1 protein-like n=1 Tax=Macadamia integrifolia TaxID=60698 RepID=UPI001C533408|nr:HIPL1 protein-like [Macadamia integrifolia]
MGSELNILCLFGQWLLLLGLSYSHPLCTDSIAPFTPKKPLTFCPYSGSVCCDSAKDLQLQKQFQSMNISDPACASLMKSILCATCDQFSAQLFDIGTRPRAVPVLCNSTISVGSTQSNNAANDFCGKVWDTCQNVFINAHPFTPLQGSFGVPTSTTSCKLTDLWKSKSDFCKVNGGASGFDSVCFAGDPVSLINAATVDPPSGVCLEKISNMTYLNMVGHPDGSNRVFMTDQQGRIWLATVPDVGSGKTLGPDELTLFLDLSDKIYYDYLLGLMGIAFHPNFVNNGRFFVSFNCNKTKWDGCFGKCSCNSDVNCNPSNFTSTYGFPPCQYSSVISEFTANGTSGNFLATKGNQTEIRRIFSMGLPFENEHGGQILFGPSDGYLYYMMGDGGGVADPYNFSQNKKSLLGKIMRFDVDHFPSARQINELGLWGNYSIPLDNPVFEDNELRPEIWALGLRNPWRCDFDSKRPSYFLCADDGEDRYEEVDLITKGGNYGWRVYEGPLLFNPPQSPGGNTSASSINPIFPVMGYEHSSINQDLGFGGAAIIGGYYYRSTTDPCLYGRYIYADFFAEVIWAGTENPENSGNFTSNQIPFTCAYDSPIQCSFTPGIPFPALGFINSFGEDNNKDVHIFATSGVYRIVQPSRCNYLCSNATSAAGLLP